MNRPSWGFIKSDFTVCASTRDITSYLFHINCTWVEHVQQLDLASWEVSQQKIQDRAGFGIWHWWMRNMEPSMSLSTCLCSWALLTFYFFFPAYFLLEDWAPLVCAGPDFFSGQSLGPGRAECCSPWRWHRSLTTWQDCCHCVRVCAGLNSAILIQQNKYPETLSCTMFWWTVYGLSFSGLSFHILHFFTCI